MGRDGDCIIPGSCSQYIEKSFRSLLHDRSFGADRVRLDRKVQVFRGSTARRWREQRRSSVAETYSIVHLSDGQKLTRRDPVRQLTHRQEGEYVGSDQGTVLADVAVRGRSLYTFQKSSLAFAPTFHDTVRRRSHHLSFTGERCNSARYHYLILPVQIGDVLPVWQFKSAEDRQTLVIYPLCGRLRKKSVGLLSSVKWGAPLQSVKRSHCLKYIIKAV